MNVTSRYFVFTIFDIYGQLCIAVVRLAHKWYNIVESKVYAMLLIVERDTSKLENSKLFCVFCFSKSLDSTKRRKTAASGCNVYARNRQQWRRIAELSRKSRGGLARRGPAYQMVRITGYKQFPSANIVMWVMNDRAPNKHRAGNASTLVQRSPCCVWKRGSGSRCTAQWQPRVAVSVTFYQPEFRAKLPTRPNRKWKEAPRFSFDLQRLRVFEENIRKKASETTVVLYISTRNVIDEKTSTSSFLWTADR